MRWMLWSPMMQEMEERLVVLDEMVDMISAGKLNVILSKPNQEFSMEGDALEMEVREPEANNGKESKHQYHAMQCNDLKQSCEQSGTCFLPNPFGKYAISGKPEWRGGVSCGLGTEQGKYYCIIYNMPCQTWQPSLSISPMIISNIYKFYFQAN